MKKKRRRRRRRRRRRIRRRKKKKKKREEEEEEEEDEEEDQEEEEKKGTEGERYRGTYRQTDKKVEWWTGKRIELEIYVFVTFYPLPLNLLSISGRSTRKKNRTRG